jgi:methionine-rich copper-binding protein CopC
VVSLEAIQKLSYEFPSTVGPIARRVTVQFLVNWVSPTYVAAGQSVTVHQDAFANQKVTVALSVDILNTQGQLVLHSSLDNQTLEAQQMTPLALNIPLPTSLPSGTYVVKTAALGPDGNHYAESESAGEFVVTVPLPAPTSVPSEGVTTHLDPNSCPVRCG